jgi:uncharacterized membrane protein HdeD (DUF308 family)
MSEQARVDVVLVDDDTALAALGRSWGVVLTVGLLGLGLGIAVMVWPNKTVAIVAALLGIMFLITGVFRIVQSFAAPGATGGQRALYAILGVLALIAGIAMFRAPFQSIAVLTFILGAFWVVDGIVGFVTGISAKGEQGRGWMIVSGVLGFIAGLILLLWPIESAVALAWITGIWLAVGGLITIFGAFQLRKAASA